jgi:hypothetical protein
MTEIFMKLMIFLLLFLSLLAASRRLNASIISLPGELGDGFTVAVTLACIFIPQTMPYTNKYPDTMMCVDNGWLDEAIRQDLYGDEASLGWGVEFERAVNETFSIRFREGLVIKNFFTNNENMYITAQDFLVDYYFDHQGLHGFNIGAGFGFANTVSTINSDQTILLDFDAEYVHVFFGYKFNYGLFVLEPYFDWITPLSDTYQSQTRIIQAIIAMVGLNIGAAF